ncbi:MAG: hypothetical protein ABJO09_09230 [Hyphomicrobiales bacterium]
MSPIGIALRRLDSPTVPLALAQGIAEPRLCPDLALKKLPSGELDVTVEGDRFARLVGRVSHRLLI